MSLSEDVSGGRMPLQRIPGSAGLRPAFLIVGKGTLEACALSILLAFLLLGSTPIISASFSSHVTDNNAHSVNAQNTPREAAQQAIQNAQAAISAAQAVIDRARTIEADVTAAVAKLNQAKEKLVVAQAAFAAGNFSLAQETANQATALADEAKTLAEAAEALARLRNQAQEALQYLQQLISQAQAAIDHARAVGANVQAAESKLNEAKSKLTQAQTAFNNREYQQAKDLATQAGQLAVQAKTLAEAAEKLVTDAVAAAQAAQQAITQAQRAVDRAKSVGADVQPAESKLNEAKAKLTQAQTAFNNKDFLLAKSLADQATSLANQAKALAEAAEKFVRDRNDALAAIQQAQQAISLAQTAINYTVTVTMSVQPAIKKLDEARAKLAQAQAAFEKNNFEQAKTLAIQAKDLADEARTLAEQATQAQLAINRAQRYIADAEAAIKHAQTLGADVQDAVKRLADAKKYLSDAKTALGQGNYLQAQTLALQAQRAAGDAQKKAKDAIADLPRPRAAGEVLIEVSAGRIEAVARRYGLKVLERLNDTDIYRVQIPDGKTIEEVLGALKKDPEVLRAEPNHLVQSPVVDQKTVFFIDQKTVFFIDGSSPSSYFDQSALTRIQLEEGQQVTKGTGITVAVIDTGIDLQHPAFENRLSPIMFDFVEGDSDPSEMGVASDPGYGHGTFVAGIVSLVAPEAKIMPLRTFNSQGEATVFNIAKAIYYAVKNGAQVINMSFGLDTPLDTPPVGIDKALEYAKAQGVVAIASAGNDGFEQDQFPAKIESVIAVAATDGNDVKASFSNYGTHIDVSAPGVGVYSTYPGGKFGWWDGTSFSTAFVSGEAALVFSLTLTMPTQDPRCSQQGPRCVVINAVQDSAINIDDKNDGYEGKLGKGRIDVLGAIRKVMP